MQPLQLTLKGFRGIRDGLGLPALSLDLERLTGDAQLIAIAGPNGSGKTTVMDNLMPYLALASRSGGALGAFSYYDHVYLPENLKELVWAHEGRCYRTQVVIRLAGRRRTEAYLHRLDGDGLWQPLRLDDGLVSDGRVETYAACVERVCGSAETFFTSVFAAQGKRQLCSYRNAEIKSLLADLLGQEEIRAIGQRASDTVRCLKQGLAALRQAQARAEDEAEGLRMACSSMQDAAARVDEAEQAREHAQAVLDARIEQATRLAALAEQQRDTERQRQHWCAERESEQSATTRALQALQRQQAAASVRQQGLVQRVSTQRQRAEQRRQALLQARQRCREALAQAPAVARAQRRLDVARHAAERRRERVDACRQQAQVLVSAQSSVCLAEQRLAGIEVEAGKAVLRVEELARRFGLTAAVPCAGSSLQPRCQLLADAHQAAVLQPAADATVARCAAQAAAARRELAAARQRVHALTGAPAALAHAQHRASRAELRATAYAMLAARAESCAQARLDLSQVSQELAALASTTGGDWPAELAAERDALEATLAELARQAARERRRSQASLAHIARALAELPAGLDASRVAAAQDAVKAARAALTAAHAGWMEAVRQRQAADDLARQAAALTLRLAHQQAEMRVVERAVGDWTLLARCMSHDGLIALAIDDAGPSLSALCNDLLAACYGTRFSVAVHTLVAASSGEAREGFDILVHDGSTGEAKSVGLMSGGERTWVEACLTRAIALYLAQHAGRQYSTLFSDEADGALDPARKRMFMAMKREVLRLGGYAREFFVSQTPELTALADVVIDLEDWRGQIGNVPCEQA